MDTIESKMQVDEELALNRDGTLNPSDIKERC